MMPLNCKAGCNCPSVLLVQFNSNQFNSLLFFLNPQSPKMTSVIQVTHFLSFQWPHCHGCIIYDLVQERFRLPVCQITQI